MKEMEKYAREKGLEVEIIAKGIGEYEEYYDQIDIILLGPQISYKHRKIEEQSAKPVLLIQPNDYATGNVINIFKQVNSVFPPKI